MVKKLAILACGAAALLGSVAAQAAIFDFSFTAQVVQFGVPQDTYLGAGKLFADDLGANIFSVTGASGALAVEGYPEWSYDISGGEGLLVGGVDGFTADGLVLTGNSGPGYYGFSLNAIPGVINYYVQFGEVGAPEAKLSITPAASVPEPATWAMLMLGVGATGLVMRRRQTIRTNIRFA